MNEHTLSVLSFYKIVTELKEYCQCQEAKNLLSNCEIFTEPALVAAHLAYTVDIQKTFASGKTIPALRFPDLGAVIPKLKKQGTILEAEELAGLAVFIKSAQLFKRFIISETTHQKLKEIAKALPDLDPLRSSIEHFIDNDANIKQKNIPALKAISKRIKNINQQIEKISSVYFLNEAYSHFWQTNVATIKDGRTVLPLKAQFKGRIKGIVHEISSSGATIFIEPADIVEKNNELVLQENNYRMEILKIIKALTSKAKGFIKEIILMIEKVAFLDSIKARAHYAIIHKCNAAIYSSSLIRLENARQPHLGNKAIPITIQMENGCQVLLITGPNTGGKTVSLITVGLLALMNQFAMAIPADEGSLLPVFDDIFADIGDEQSIEQSLSTFSSHMSNIASIIKKATAKSLVLLDELGAGTDPEEGTAIAMSILDYLLEQGVKVFATTHHGILKNYGYLKSGVSNASVDFDRQSLTPTYNIIMGIPGESHALTIAERNGILRDVIKRAVEYLNDERTDISRLIEQLSRRQRDLKNIQEKQKKKEVEIKEKLRQADLKELKLRQQEYELREKGLLDLNRFLAQSRKDLEHIIKEMRENQNIAENIKEGRDLVQAIKKRVDQESKKITSYRVSEKGKKHYDFKKGDLIVLKVSGKRGELVRKTRDGSWIVKTANLKVTVSGDEIEPYLSAADKQPPGVVLTEYEIGTEPVFELNVRGLRLEQALRRLEKQLDAALVRGIKEFTILHGKGTGILQKGIHEYLGNSSLIVNFYFTRPELGGTGKTIVHLK